MSDNNKVDILSKLQDNSDYSTLCPDCGKPVNTVYSTRIGIGFSHIVVDKDNGGTRSYSQVFNTQHCCSFDCSIKCAHDRIDSHSSIPFGSYDEQKHNPTGDTDIGIIKANLNYNPYNSAKIPQKCAICDKSTSEECYVPHVDDSSRGKHYQDVLQSEFPMFASFSHEDLTFGACSMEHAIDVAHKIVDTIIKPAHERKQK